MAKLNDTEIIRVINAMIGDIEPRNGKQANRERRDNQRTLMVVTEQLISWLVGNANHAADTDIGREAEEFLQYLAGEYFEEYNDEKWTSD